MTFLKLAFRADSYQIDVDLNADDSWSGMARPGIVSAISADAGYLLMLRDLRQ